MVELIEQSALAVDELIDVLGRASIEAVSQLSAQGIAGPPHPGKKGGAIGWHGRETGTVCLADRKLRVGRSRLVCGYLPQSLRRQGKLVLRVAWKLEPEEGMVRLRKQAEWLDFLCVLWVAASQRVIRR